MTKKEATNYLKFANGWKLKKNSISLESRFKDFAGAMEFINKVGRVAEREGHHPDIYLYSWNRVRLDLSTHSIKGLSVNDFILAAKINNINQKER